MKSISKLKDQARGHEQKEEWEKAAQLYLQAIRAAEEAGAAASELGLYNRIGDIYLRLGKATDAVAFYEQAADHYAADGLYNNAIALCNKALRHLPERLELYRKLGRLSASQGFQTDARRWFVEYSERRIKRGELDEAFTGLRELADLTDDAEVRQLLASQLHAHGRTAEAVVELGRAYATRLRSADLIGAEAVREAVRALDPEAAETLDEHLEAAPKLAGPLDGLPLLEELPPLGLETAAGAAGLEEEAAQPAPAGEAAPAQAPQALPLEGFDPTAVGELGGLTPPAPAAAAPEAVEPEPAAPEATAPEVPLEAWGRELEQPEPAPELESAAFTPVEEEPQAAPPPLEEIEPEEEEELAQPLPLMSLDEPGEEEGAPVEVEYLPSPLPWMDLGDEEELEPLPPLPLLEEEQDVDVPPLAAEREESPFSPPLPMLWNMGDDDEEPLPLLEEPVLGPLPLLEEPPVGPATAIPPLDIPGLEPAPPPLPPFEVAVPGATPLPWAATLHEDPWAVAPEDELSGVRLLYGRGQRAVGRGVLERLIATAERAADTQRALQLLDALAAAEPDDLDVHQRRVECAFRMGGPKASVPALLGLAAAQTRAGMAPKASVVYLQVLDIDPYNAEAGAAMRRERDARPKPKDDGGYIDLGALLMEDEDFQETTRFVVPGEVPSGNEEEDFVAMLEQFKGKVSEQMGEDPQAHYDLGLAYKEMGLLDEAITEFQVALRGGADRLKVLEELGRCFLLKEQPTVALRLLQQALQLTGRTEMEYMGVYYLLGRCHEELGSAQAAREAYERVVGLDLQFDDVAERLARL